MVLPCWHITTAIVALNVASSLAAPIGPRADHTSMIGLGTPSPLDHSGRQQSHSGSITPSQSLDRVEHWQTTSTSHSPQEITPATPRTSLASYLNHESSSGLHPTHEIGPASHPAHSDDHKAPPVSTPEKQSFLKKLQKGADHDFFHNPVSIGVSLIGVSAGIASVIHAYNSRDVDDLEDPIYERAAVLAKLD